MSARNLCASCYWSEASKFTTRDEAGVIVYGVGLLCANPGINRVPRSVREPRTACDLYQYEPGTDSDYYKVGGTA